MRVVGVAMVGALFSSDAWNNVTFTAGEIRNPRRNLPISLALGVGVVIAALPRLQLRLSECAAAGRHPVRAGGSRGYRGWSRFWVRWGWDDGGGHHGLHLWVPERHDSGGRARLLCHGA